MKGWRENRNLLSFSDFISMLFQAEVQHSLQFFSVGDVKVPAVCLLHLLCMISCREIFSVVHLFLFSDLCYFSVKMLDLMGGKYHLWFAHIKEGLGQIGVGMAPRKR